MTSNRRTRIVEYQNALFYVQNELNWATARTLWQKPPDGLELEISYLRGKCAEIQQNIDTLLAMKTGELGGEYLANTGPFS